MIFNCLIVFTFSYLIAKCGGDASVNNNNNNNDQILNFKCLNFGISKGRQISIVQDVCFVAARNCLDKIEPGNPDLDSLNDCQFNFYKGCVGSLLSQSSFRSCTDATIHAKLGCPGGGRDFFSRVARVYCARLAKDFVQGNKDNQG